MNQIETTQPEITPTPTATEGVWLPAAPDPLPPYLGKFAFLITFTPAIAMFFVLEALLALTDSDFAWGTALATTTGFLVCGALYKIVQRFETLAIRDKEAEMLPELNARDGVLVSLSIIQGRAVTGVDRGLMWVENSRLCFCGHRTSFSLGRGDVIGGPVDFWAPGKTGLLLDHGTPVGPLRISFTQLIGDRPFRKPIHKSVFEWCLETGPEERGQIPPTALGLGSPTSQQLRKAELLRAFVLPTYFGLLLAPLFFAAGVLPLFFILYAIAILAFLILPAQFAQTPLKHRQLLESFSHTSEPLLPSGGEGGSTEGCDAVAPQVDGDEGK